MADAVVKPIKMAKVVNPKKGYIKTPTVEEVQKYEERLKKLGRDK
tara:strand:- start:594 stop:728 length:135 start_codon:yes stop_codon:yes gene_type:complete